MKNQLLLLSLTSILLLGCSNTGSKLSTSTKAGANAGPKDWFCEEASGDWDCSQLTKLEIAHRTAEREREAEIKREKAAEELTLSEELETAAPDDKLPARRALEIEASTPGYISLSYKSRTPTSLLDLPETFWAIQIMALQNQDTLNEFVVDKQLAGVSGAKVASEGKLFYVLLLGVYESRSIAEEAWKSRPQSIAYLQPYYRSLGSLQSAIREGQNLQP